MRFKLSVYALLGLMVFSPLAAQASSIVVIQGEHTRFGRKFFAGFSSLVREKIIAFQYDVAQEQKLLEKIKEVRPDLIVTIGVVPLEKLLQKLPSTPFIVGDYYAEKLKDRANIILMENSQPVETALRLGLSLTGNRKNMGVVYDPKYSNHVYTDLVAYTQKNNINLLAVKVDKPEDVVSLVPAFKGKIDSYFFARDITTSAPMASRAIYSVTQSEKIPVFSLDPNHRNMGALLTVSIDPVTLGEQAWSIAKVILKQRKIPQLPSQVYAAELTLNLSLEEASLMGLTEKAILAFLGESASAGYDVRVSR